MWPLKALEAKIDSHFLFSLYYKWKRRLDPGVSIIAKDGRQGMHLIPILTEKVTAHQQVTGKPRIAQVRWHGSPARRPAEAFMLCSRYSMRDKTWIHGHNEGILIRLFCVQWIWNENAVHSALEGQRESGRRILHDDTWFGIDLFTELSRPVKINYNIAWFTVSLIWAVHHQFLNWMFLLTGDDLCGELCLLTKIGYQLLWRNVKVSKLDAWEYCW